MKNKQNLFLSVLVLVPLLMALEAHATIYKCVDANAEVYYNDKPCPVTDIERKIKAVKDPEGGYIPPEFVADQAKSASPGIVVGNESGRKLDQSNKDKSDNSSQVGASNGSSSGAKGTSSGSSNNSSANSNVSSSSSTENSDSASATSSGIKRTTKRVIQKERDYEKVVKKYDD